MSSIRFRQKALDHNKPLPIYREEDHPDVLLETAALSRAVPDMPTGMEKEEEEEIHVKQIIDQKNRKGALAQLNLEIPIPEITHGVPLFKQLHKPDYKLPSTYIKPSLLATLEEQPPDYDMDEEDKEWLNEFNKNRTEPMAELEFEKKMDAIEKHYPMTMDRICDVVGLDKDTLHPIYQHYVRRLGQVKAETLMPRIKTSAPDASSKGDPYIAFRRRVERMQTRKNRQQNEAHFMNMLKLRRDLGAAREMLRLMMEREDAKARAVDSEIRVLRCRYAAQDYSGQLLRECMPWLQPPPTPQQPKQAALPTSEKSALMGAHEQAIRAQKKKKKKKKGAAAAADTLAADQQQAQKPGKPMAPPKVSLKIKLGAINQLDAKRLKKRRPKEEEDELVYVDTSAVTEPEYARDDPYRFRRRTNVYYHAPLSRQSMCFNRKGRFSHYDALPGHVTPPSLSRRVPLLRGFCRRRIGRGGRVIFDRTHPTYDALNELAEPEPEHVEDEHDLSIPRQLLFVRHFPSRPAVPPPAPTTTTAMDTRQDGASDATALLHHPAPQLPAAAAAAGGAPQHHQQSPVAVPSMAAPMPSNPATAAATSNGQQQQQTAADDPVQQYPTSGTVFAEVGSSHFFGNDLQHKRPHPPSP
ncbi:Epc1 protein [Salpingoeca rosetta]|uniref:Enhancer of polycomb-like protein n=1 Tax=Salpingoeca rosetta (strain ATCC 50818 / BSB-021) TaxID=946362 RepID=F2U876_SALR5|nr:Epc1 protein [Salpingoeca rosetta]EGD72584.1 Epc1 protein [Salpingoeca rosetta]|eukprot:XP_004994407.1 Epc1 protein [Salpingoeca rosetta]